MAKVHTLIHLFKGTCVYCRVPVKPPLRDQTGIGSLTPFTATVDHAIPKSRGGKSLDGKNYVLACFRCNGAKNDMTSGEFRAFLRTGRFSPSYVAYLEGRTLERLGGRRLLQELEETA